MYSELIGAAIAPAFQTPSWAMMLWGEFGTQQRHPLALLDALGHERRAERIGQLLETPRTTTRVPLKISAVWSGRWRTVSLRTSRSVHSG